MKWFSHFSVEGAKEGFASKLFLGEKGESVYNNIMDMGVNHREGGYWKWHVDIIIIVINLCHYGSPMSGVKGSYCTSVN